MYVLSFNINQKDGSEIRVLTEFPTLLINENFNEVIYNLRTIIKEHIPNISASYEIPIVDIKLGMSILYTKEDFITMHSCSINLMNIRETIEIIKKLSND